LIQVFEIKGTPRGQGRARARNHGKFARVYEDPEDTKYKENIKAQIANQNPQFIAQGKPVLLCLVYHMERPKGHYGAKGNVTPKHENEDCVSKPDVDNMEKACKDAMKGIVWHDDNQVVCVWHFKQYAEVPKVQIFVSGGGVKDIRRFLMLLMRDHGVLDE